MGIAASRLEARKTKEHYSFKDWLHFLDGAVLTAGWKYRIVQETGEECWLDYYECGYTPLEALLEDFGSAY